MKGVRNFRFLWPCIMSKAWREKLTRCNNKMFIINFCFWNHYAHLQENKDRVTAYGVLLWFCWMWLITKINEQCSSKYSVCCLPLLVWLEKLSLPSRSWTFKRENFFWKDQQKYAYLDKASMFKGGDVWPQVLLIVRREPKFPRFLE